MDERDDRQPRIIEGVPRERDAQRGDTRGAHRSLSHKSERALAELGAAASWVGDGAFAIVLLADPAHPPLAITVRRTGSHTVDAVFQPSLSRQRNAQRDPTTYRLRLPAGVDATQPVDVTIVGLGEPIAVTLDPA